MGGMPIGCYKQMIAIKKGVIMRLQCIYIIKHRHSIDILNAHYALISTDLNLESNKLLIAHSNI